MNNASEQLDKDLKNCVNMEQVLAAVNKHYDLSKPFGIATKLLVITGVKKILDLVKAQPRQTWSK
jgi:hypothetical protein